MSSPDAPLAPQTVAAATTGAMPPYLRARAGAAWTEVRGAEVRARRMWAALAERETIPRGVRFRAALLARRAVALLEGDASRLARALRQQPSPWELSGEPLRGALGEVAEFESRARDLLQLIDEIEGLRERYAELRGTYGAALPKAWARWTAVSGADESAIEGCRSRAMLDALRFWIDAGRDQMERWKAEIHAWLESAGIEVDLAANAGPGVVDADLEHRYELLLAVSAIDRTSLHHEVAEGLRRGVRTSLEALGPPPGAARDDPLESLARQYGESPDEELGLDEAWIYREALMARNEARRRTAGRSR